MEAARLLKSVGLEEKASAYFAQLSGGQQQTAISPFPGHAPTLMLFDEPTTWSKHLSVTACAVAAESESRPSLFVPDRNLAVARNVKNTLGDIRAHPCHYERHG